MIAPSTRRRPVRRVLLSACAILFGTVPGAATVARAADVWWAGDVGSLWNTGPGGNTNFSSLGSSNSNTPLLPGPAEVVRFSVPGAGNLATTLGQDFSILGLRLEAGIAPANVSGNTLTLGASGVTNASGSSLTLGSTLLASGVGYAFNASGGGQILVTGNLSGADKTLFKSGPGMLTFSGSAGFSGATTVSAGTLELVRSAGFSVLSPITVAAGATLRLTATDVWGGHRITASSPLTVAGTVASSGSYNTLISPVFNGGTLLLNGGSQTRFPAFALKGTVAVGGVAASRFVAGTGSLNAINIGTSGVPGATTFDVSDATASAAADLTIAVPMQDNQNNSSSAAVAGTLIKAGPGTLALSASNSYSGGTTLAGGNLRILTAAAFPALGPMTFSGGTLQYTGSNLTDYSSRIAGSTSAVVIDTGGHSITFSGALDISNTAGLTKLGEGTLTLGNTNTLFGPLAVRGGTLVTGIVDSLPYVGPVTVENATLRFDYNDLWGNYQTTVTPVVNILSGGTVASNGTYTTLVNPVFRGGTLLANGGANENLPAFGLRGTVTVDGTEPGRIAAGTGTLNVVIVGTPHGFDFDHMSTAFDVADVTSSPAADLSIDLPVQNFFNGFTRVDSGITKKGPGTLVLSADNTFTGPTTVSAGTLQIGNGGTTGSVAGNIVNEGALVVSRTTDLTLPGQISGVGSLTKYGAGTLTLAADNPFSGPTVIIDGTLRIGVGGATGSIAGDILNNAALVVDRSTDLTLPGRISGGGTFTKLGAGTLTLAGAGTFSGTTTVSAGTLQLGDGTTPVILGGPIVNHGTLAFFAEGAPVTSFWPITGPGPILKLGTNALRLYLSKSQSGPVSVLGGSLSLSTDIGDDLPGGTPSIFVGPGATLDLPQSNTFGRHIATVTPAVTVAAGGTLSSNNSFNTLVNLTLAGGTVVCNGGQTDLFPSLGLKGTLTVTGSVPSSILPGTGNSFVAVNIGPTDAPGVLTVDVADVTASPAADLTVGVPLLNNKDNIAFTTAILSGLTKTGPGTLLLAADNSFTGPVTVSAGTLQIGGGGGAGGSVRGPIINNASLVVARAGALTLPGRLSGTGVTTKTGTGTLSFFGQLLPHVQGDLVITAGVVDLRTSPLVLRNADLATLRGYVASGALKSTGPQPFARLAVASNDAGGGVPFYASYGDLLLSASDVLLRYTYTGDTNLDGLVNGLDLANFLEGFSTHATGWQNGDFNYDGAVTPADYALLAPALAANLPSLGSPAQLPASGSSVPEPAAAGLLLLPAAAHNTRPPHSARPRSSGPCRRRLRRT